jgi:hypothetical protein
VTMFHTFSELKRDLKPIARPFGVYSFPTCASKWGSQITVRALSAQTPSARRANASIIGPNSALKPWPPSWTCKVASTPWRRSSS